MIESYKREEHESQKIIRPKVSQNVHFEGELTVIMKETCHQLLEGEDVRPFIFGYTCANEVHCPRPAKKRQSMDERQGLRHVLPAGAGGQRQRGSMELLIIISSSQFGLKALQ
jgi:2-keto-4-pentenoate hydratase/2-oxohepta-3-ene-1,7-dioic acid hydratase in catechol pathway